MTATITPMTVDTLAVAQRLAGAGMPTEQAEAVAGSLRDVAALDRTDLLDRFATREDLLEANAAMKEDLLEANAAMKEDLFEAKQELLAADAALKQELLEAIATMDVKLVAMEAKLIRWTVGAVLSAAGVALAIARLI